MGSDYVAVCERCGSGISPTKGRCWVCSAQDDHFIKALESRHDITQAEIARLSAALAAAHEGWLPAGAVVAEREARQKAEAALDAMRAERDTLRALADAADSKGHRSVSFAAVCDSLDSKDTEAHVYDICVSHMRRSERAESALTRCREALAECEGWIVPDSTAGRPLLKRIRALLAEAKGAQP